MTPPRKKTARSKPAGSKTGNPSTVKQILKWTFRIGLILVGFFMLIVLFVYLGLFGKLPSENDLKLLKSHSSSLVYSIDGKIMGGYYLQNRQAISNQEMSKYVKDALISTEDSRFFEHKGLDFVSLGRVIVKTIFMGDLSQGGGSTISQQLAKNLYPRKRYGPVSLLVNKVREIFVANRLEKAFTKEEILNMYLNTIPFGEEVYGIEAASQRFFNKKSKFLNPAESATLIGMLAANTGYNPRLNPEKSKARRNIVLSRMGQHHRLTSEEVKKWQGSELKIDYNRIDRNTGLAPYFREKIRIRVEEILEDKYGDEYDLYADGLKIYTTIDSRLQTYAEEAAQRHMKVLQVEFNNHWKGRDPWAAKPSVLNDAIRQSRRYKSLKADGLSDKEVMSLMKQPVKMSIVTPEGEKVVEMSPVDSVKHYLKMLNVGFMAMDAKTGYILAWVGGVNHKVFQYDHVTARRQVGSTFKPFVYTAALLAGIEPCEFISNERRVYDDYNDWSPENSDGEYGGFYSMKGGLANSVNTIAADLIMKTGVSDVITIANEMGIDSDIPKYPSIALGTADLSLHEMVRAYAVFANGGRKVEPVGLLRIEDKNGKVLYKHKDALSETVIDSEVARVMAEMMKGVISDGTGRSLRSVYGITGELAGKTGTTQNNTDGWFIGYTPSLVAGAWVGNDQPAIHFRSTGLGQGAHTALPVFGMFMNKTEADPRFNKYTRVSFPQLPDYVAAKLDCELFAMEDPSQSVFEKLFRRQGVKADSTSLKKPYEKGSDKRQVDHPGLLQRMKDLFRKKSD